MLTFIDQNGVVITRKLAQFTVVNGQWVRVFQ